MKPTCGICKKEMTPQNSRRAPELFMCDDCVAANKDASEYAPLPNSLTPSGATKRYFFDTEFIEAGRNKPLTLISIGLACDDGRTFYAVSNEFRDEDCNAWVKANVLPHLGSAPRHPILEIASSVIGFVAESKPEFWAYYADYDWVVFCQMFGAMIDLPKGWPMFCRDIKQLCVSLGNPKLPEQTSTEHNALADALWNKQAYDFLMAQASGASREATREWRLEYGCNESELLFANGTVDWSRVDEMLDEYAAHRSAADRQEIERLTKELADSRTNHIDANTRNIEANKRAERAESELAEVVPQRNKWAMLCDKLGHDYKTTCVADISDELEKMREHIKELEAKSCEK